MDSTKQASKRQVKFGEWLHLARQNDRLTQRELADKLDVTATYISKMENAKIEVMPSLDVLAKMATVFRLPEIAVLNVAGVYDKSALEQALDNKPERVIQLNKLIAQWEQED